MTFADVGEAAGYSRGLPAAIFGTKDNLIVQAAKRITEVPVTQTLFNTEPADSVAEMIDVIEHWFELISLGAEEVRGMLVLLSVGMISETAKRFPELLDVLQSIDGTVRTRFETFLENGKARGELRPEIDIKVESILILGSIRGIFWQWLIAPEAYDLVKVGRYFTGQLRDRLQLRT
jgi:AcrR family transcriptional regulator